MDDDCSSEIVTEEAPERRHKVSPAPGRLQLPFAALVRLAFCLFHCFSLVYFMLFGEI